MNFYLLTSDPPTVLYSKIFSRIFVNHIIDNFIVRGSRTSSYYAQNILGGLSFKMEEKPRGEKRKNKKETL